MLAFLHTAAVHVASFARLARELDGAVPTRHVVREDLLARALADGRVADTTRRETQAEVQRLVTEGARVVVCTCSTLGSAAEQTPTDLAATVLRVDRPMAQHAASLGRPVLVVAATATALATALALLNEVKPQGPQLVCRELLCSEAWERFQAGDHAGYAATLAERVDEHARPNDVVMLAQASMAPAALLVRRSDVQVLTSPDAAVRAALSLLAAPQAR
jgi:hypothetical protein